MRDVLQYAEHAIFQEIERHAGKSPVAAGGTSETRNGVYWSNQ
jgi:hypothetical protein